MSRLFNPSRPQALQIDDVLFRPASRSFVVASTRAGKSTLCGHLLSRYVRLYPTHILYIVDPKWRFIPSPNGKDPRLFPEGVTPRIHRKRMGVATNARLLLNPHNWRFEHERIFIVRDPAAVLAMLQYVMDHADVTKPVIIYFDESFDIMEGFRASPPLRRVIQMGGEAGIGTVIVNQRPRNVDATFISESEQLYIGHLNREEDRKFMSQNADMPDADLIRDPVARYTWWLVDQVAPSRSVKFRFNQGDSNSSREGAA